MRFSLITAAALLFAGQAIAAPTPVGDIVNALKDGGSEDSKSVPGERGFDFLGSGKAAAPVTRAQTAAPATQRRATARRAIDMRLEFALGSAELSDAARAEAQQFAAALKNPQLAGRRFTVEGHTDAIGDRAYNAELSRRRAQAVVDFLISEGVEAVRLQPAGYGYDRLRFPARPRDGGNRRVEISRRG